MNIFLFIFGIYANIILFKTNNFYTIFLLHSYCNFMGAPNFNFIKGYEKTLKFCLYSGLISFFILLIY